MTWLKLHHELLSDIKFRRFTPQEKWAWVALLILASSSSDRGFITADDEDIADVCEFNSTQDWLYFKDKLRSKGMIEPTEKGLRITNWEKRQHVKPSDTPEKTKKRKQDQRDREKEAKDKALEDSQSSSHAPVTPLSRENHATDKIQIRSEETRSEQKREDLSESEAVEPQESGAKSSEFSFSENASLTEPEVATKLPVPSSHAAEPSAASNTGLETKDSAATNFSKKEKVELTHAQMIDQSSARFAYPECRWNEIYDLYKFGLSHLWVGPERHDWHPALIAGATAYKVKIEQPHELHFVQQYIRNLLFKKLDADLEARFNEGLAIEARKRSNESTIASPSTQAFVPPVDDFDREAARAAKQRTHLMLLGRRSA
ncbi:hypothetical protein AVDCRST_MAG94-4310 [uncultured Leptolyngbya sp.]|uniref:Uncharacterized protein n=1 Tax=uncultured Leptolyngbya sp. TaxID=332963 RepID=A0A6J4N378_9CYAN|nr:hypothetical protein AVDCRST_MAG94-4310 [uncultured Leptolyngbya sp.]